MKKEFWHNRWDINHITFHGSEAHKLLVEYFNELSLPEESRIFVPLCGKTLDISWLLSKGYRVAGAELSQKAIDELFSESGLSPDITELENLTHYSAENIDIFVGDIFNLTAEILGPVDAVYDRAAMVALPEEMRTNYARHMMEITQKAPQLVISYDYDQTCIDGPPFSVSGEELHQHYDKYYTLKNLARVDVPGGLKGKCDAAEHIWLLKNDE